MLSTKFFRDKPHTTRATNVLIKSVDLSLKQHIQKKVILTNQKIRPLTANSTRKDQKTLVRPQKEPKSQGDGAYRPKSANTSLLISNKTASTQRPISKDSQRPNSQLNQRLQKPAVKPKTIKGEIIKTKTIVPQRRELQPSYCGICFDLLVISRIHAMKVCGTRFHFNCVKNYILSCSNSSGLLFKCPAEGCNDDLKENEILSFLSKEQRKTFIRRLKLKEVMENPSKLTICSTLDCEHIFTIPAENPVACGICPLCKKDTCVFCKSPFHKNLTCEEHKTFKQADLVLFENFAAKKWKRCMNCLFWIEKSDGCNHMTCKCGNEFCYLCGTKWKTCKCEPR